MPRKPAKWPSYALWALEDVQALLLDVQRLARQAQEASVNGDRLLAVVMLGDIREKSSTAVNKLVQARSGEYEQEDEENNGSL